MPHTFTVETPKDIHACFKKLKSIIAASDGHLEGDEATGNISLAGCQGSYHVKADGIHITIQSKPRLLASKLIETRIRAAFLG